MPVGRTGRPDGTDSGRHLIGDARPRGRRGEQREQPAMPCRKAPADPASTHRQSAGQQGAADSRQHVAAAGRREVWRRRAVDPHLAGRRRDQRRGALEQHRHAKLGGRAADVVEPMRLDVGRARRPSAARTRPRAGSAGSAPTGARAAPTMRPSQVIASASTSTGTSALRTASTMRPACVVGAEAGADAPMPGPGRRASTAAPSPGCDVGDDGLRPALPHQLGRMRDADKPDHPDAGRQRTADDELRRAGVGVAAGDHAEHPAAVLVGFARAAAATGPRRRPRRAGSLGALGSVRPMSTTSTWPACSAPGATTSPSFSAPNVTVTSARTATPATSPVDASTPLGTSTATTVAATSQSAIRVASRAIGSRSAPVAPMPTIPSRTRSAREPAAATVRSRCRPPATRLRRTQRRRKRRASPTQSAAAHPPARPARQAAHRRTARRRRCRRNPASTTTRDAVDRAEQRGAPASQSERGALHQRARRATGSAAAPRLPAPSRRRTQISFVALRNHHRDRGPAVV